MISVWTAAGGGLGGWKAGRCSDSKTVACEFTSSLDITRQSLQQQMTMMTIAAGNETTLCWVRLALTSLRGHVVQSVCRHVRKGRDSHVKPSPTLSSSILGWEFVKENLFEGMRILFLWRARGKWIFSNTKSEEKNPHPLFSFRLVQVLVDTPVPCEVVPVTSLKKTRWLYLLESFFCQSSFYYGKIIIYKCKCSAEWEFMWNKSEEESLCWNILHYVQLNIKQIFSWTNSNNINSFSPHSFENWKGYIYFVWLVTRNFQKNVSKKRNFILK